MQNLFYLGVDLTILVTVIRDEIMLASTTYEKVASHMVTMRSTLEYSMLFHLRVEIAICNHQYSMIL